MSKIVSGHAITAKGIENLMRDHENEQRQTKSSQTVSKKRQSNSKTQKENAPRQKPTISKMKVKKVTKPKVASAIELKPGPSHIAIDSTDSNSDMSVDSDISPEKLCCICKRNTPKELRHCTSIVFPK